MSLNQDRNTPWRDGQLKSLPLKAATILYGGAIGCLANGVLVPGSAALGLVAVGISQDRFDNSAGADGDIIGTVRTGAHRLGNSAAGDEIAVSDIGSVCWIVDDQTVAKTCGGGARSPCGEIVDVDANGVWVDVGKTAVKARTVRLLFAISETDTLAGTSAELISPVAGAITSCSVIVQKAITTGGPITVDVGGTPVVGLSVVIPDASAKGAIVTDTPTAGDASTVVAVGSRIQVVPDAAFATAGAVSGYVEITY
jgi:hypothetical protein